MVYTDNSDAALSVGVRPLPYGRGSDTPPARVSKRRG